MTNWVWLPILIVLMLLFGPLWGLVGAFVAWLIVGEP